MVDPRKERVKRNIRIEVKKDLFNLIKERAVPDLIDIIMEDYGSELTGVVDASSDLAPEHFMSVFYDRLEAFDFVKDHGQRMTITCPDMENFNFSNGLELIQTILEGIVGTWVEIPGKDYTLVSGNKILNDEYVEENRSYLFKLTNEVKRWEAQLNKKFNVFEFSNSSPRDIFTRGEKFVEDNLDKWIDESVSLSINEMDRG